MASQLPAYMSIAGDWKVASALAASNAGLTTRGARLCSIVFYPTNVYGVLVLVDGTSACIASASGYNELGRIEIKPDVYDYSAAECKCANLLELDDVSVALALATIPVDLRLAFTTRADRNLFSEWFVRTARAAHDARAARALSSPPTTRLSARGEGALPWTSADG